MIVIDIETSGLSAKENGLLSIGAVDLSAPRNRFYGECRIKTSEKIDPEALAINGFSAAQARDKDKPSTKKLLQEFSAWLEQRPNKVIGGLHISAFDVPFINQKAESCRVPLRLHRRTIDLHSLVYAKMLSLKKVIPLTDGWSVMDTEVIYPFCGLTKEPEPKNALSGAVWEAECLSRIIYGKPLFKKFEKFELPRYLAK